MIAGEHYDALCRLGHKLFTRGQTSRAERIFRGLTALAPDRSYAWRLLGACRHAQSDPQGSAAAFERAMELDPDAAQTRIAYAELLAEHRRIRDALALLEPLVHPRDAGPNRPGVNRARSLWRRWSHGT